MNILELAVKKLLVDEEHGDQAVTDQRWSACLSCQKFKKTNLTCVKCGCYLNVKIPAKVNFNIKHGEYEVTHCPLGKWNDKELAEYYKNKRQ